MTLSTLIGTGWVSGRVTSGSANVANVLVAVEAAGVAYTSISNSSGDYAIYNVPFATYTVKGYAQSYAFTSPTTTVVATTGNLNVNLTASTAVGGTVLVNLSAIAAGRATDPVNMVVSLVHPITKETIPGLSQTKTYTPPLSYSLSGVVDGSYFVRSTFANDTLVVDPDYIVKFGEPSVVVSGGMATPNPVGITITFAVPLISPSNILGSTQPVTVTSLTPTFIWSAYSSTKDYVIEVMDANSGTIVWGGITGMGTPTPVRSFLIPPSETSIIYNSATPLLVGKTYRWRIYASVDDSTTTLGWKLISMSEDQMGLFTVN